MGSKALAIQADMQSEEGARQLSQQQLINASGLIFLSTMRE
jgi:hypothetical protein